MGWGRAFVHVQQTLRARGHKACDLQVVVAPASAGLGLRCHVHRPHAGGFLCARRFCAEQGLKVRPHPSERLPRVSRADGGNGGRIAWCVGGCFTPQRQFYFNATVARQERGGCGGGFVGACALVGWWGGVASRHCLAGRLGGTLSRVAVAAICALCLAHALASERLCVCGWNRASYSLFVLLCARCLVWVVM